MFVSMGRKMSVLFRMLFKRRVCSLVACRCVLFGSCVYYSFWISSQYLKIKMFHFSKNLDFQCLLKNWKIWQLLTLSPAWHRWAGAASPSSSLEHVHSCLFPGPICLFSLNLLAHSLPMPGTCSWEPRHEASSEACILSPSKDPNIVSEL